MLVDFNLIYPLLITTSSLWKTLSRIRAASQFFSPTKVGATLNGEKDIRSLVFVFVFVFIWLERKDEQKQAAMWWSVVVTVNSSGEASEEDEAEQAYSSLDPYAHRQHYQVQC